MTKNEFIDTVTENTPMFTFTANFSGYTLLENFVGDSRKADYHGVNREDIINGIIINAADYWADNGLWLSQESCKESDYERPLYMSLEEFTPIELANSIIAWCSA